VSGYSCGEGVARSLYEGFDLFYGVRRSWGAVTKSADGLLYDTERRLCVPNGRLRMVLMHDAHDEIMKGHRGVEKCYQDLSTSFAWPSKRRDVKEYVRSCNSCQRNKPRNQSKIRLLDPLEVPTRRLEQVTLDFVRSCRARPQAMIPSWLLWIDCRNLCVFFLQCRMWTLLGLRSCSSTIGIGTMVSRARLYRTVTGVSLASFGRSSSG
jgi:Integrase zinc binding domain